MNKKESKFADIEVKIKDINEKENYHTIFTDKMASKLSQSILL